MLSVSLIVRDEAHRLETCLASVAGFADEVVVLDTGSEDDSRDVARRCGAEVHELPWPGDFAPARNHALGLVRGDWVLVLDADERLREEAREPLRRLMAEPDVLVVNLLRRELGAAQSPFSSLSRLFRRHPALRWNRAYHATIDDSVMALQESETHWRVVSCDEPALVHEGYRREHLADGSKARRLRQAMEAELRQRPGDPYACAKLGALEVSEGNRRRGVALLEEGLRRCGADVPPLRYELLLHLAMAVAADQPTRALMLYREALALPLDPRLQLAARLNLAALLLRGRKPEQAARHAREVVRLDPELAIGWYDLGLIERQRGDLAAAIAAYRRAIALEPRHPESHQNLAVALLLGGDIGGAREGFRTAIGLLHAQARDAEATELRSRAAALVKLEG
jgi:tetratricopeptide (TPR) repeat protein